MWRSIRLHPWRLEIVPAAAFALTVWSAYAYEVRLARITRIIPELRIGWLVALPAFWIGWALFNWLIGFGHNQTWVQSERRKRVNGYALVAQCGVITSGWFGYALNNVFRQMMHRFIPPVISIPLLFVMLAVGTAVTATLEWTRRYIPREETPEPPLPADAASMPCYREVQTDWWYLSSSFILLLMTGAFFAVAVAAHLSSIEPGVGLILGMAALICVDILVGSLGCNVLAVTPDSATHWSSVFRIRLPVAEMESCVGGDRNSWGKPRGVKMTSRRKRGERFVEITMTNGRVYRLGALRPTHICQLIGKPAPETPESDT